MRLGVETVCVSLPNEQSIHNSISTLNGGDGAGKGGQAFTRHSLVSAALRGVREAEVSSEGRLEVCRA